MLLLLIGSCKEVQSYSTMHLFNGWHFQHWDLTRRDFELQSISAFQFASCIQPGTKLINPIQSANFPITERIIPANYQFGDIFAGKNSLSNLNDPQGAICQYVQEESNQNLIFLFVSLQNYFWGTRGSFTHQPKRGCRKGSKTAGKNFSTSKLIFINQ